MERCRMVVAFAKRSGVARVLPHMAAFRKRGGRISVTVGVDVKGTSREALELLLASTDEVFVTHQPDSSCTFHPKVYLFDGPTGARSIVGSHNLTAGGLEVNYEAGVAFEFDFAVPTDQAVWTAEFEPAWNDLLPAAHANTLPLDGALLAKLVGAGLVLDERVVQAASRKARSTGSTGAKVPLPFAGISVIPPTALPASAIPKTPKSKASGTTAVPAAPATAASMGSILVIQVNPHQNSEVFLSKRALDQNPDFFGWPWAGTSTPKSGSNTGYPQRIPIPTTLIRAHDQNDVVVFEKSLQTLMVFYTKKAEVRVTIGQEALPHVPTYSVVVIRNTDAGLAGPEDFEWDVYPPGSPNHAKFLTACDQTLPGGGGTPRKMGWL